MTRVAIVGGGIGGLTAARALCARGVEVAVYEAAPELREIGAGVALHANAMKVLRSLGLEDDVRATAGRSEWAVTRNGKTGRVISRTSRQQQAALFGSTGATVHRADLLDVLAQSLPSHVVTLGARCVGVEADGGVAAARLEDGSEVEADAIIGADGIHSAVRGSLFGPDAPRFTGKICYRSVVPVDAVPGGPPPNDNVQWLGPHGTIVLYPVRRDELINVVATTTTRATGTSRGSPGASARRCSSAIAAGTSRCCGSSPRETSGTSGRSTTGTRSGSGRRVGSPCSATPRTRCCRTWGRVRASRSRMAACSPRRSRRGRTIRWRRSRCTSAHGVPGRARSCSPRASAASATISPRRWRP